MRVMKSSVVATVAIAAALGATATTASAKKYKPHTRDFVAGALVGAAVVSVAAHEECKKWKVRYKRTGDPYFLDRYYACKY